jgi:squalene cyclase
MRKPLHMMLVTCLAVGLVVPSARAQESEVPRTLTPSEMLTPRTQKAIERGLTYLASIQRDDGSWAYQGSAGNTGITALAGLAFLAGGSTPGRGKYGTNLDKAVEYIVKNTRKDGYITAGNSRMYEHGFATLFLAEVYGMTPTDVVKEKLALAVGLIERTQNGQGGWRYNPVPYDADISVTICQIMALRAARNAGIQVSKGVIDGGIKYVKACQNGDGGFSYIAGSSGSGFARTAAGVCSLYYAGEYEDKAIRRGLDYLYKNIRNNRVHAGHFHYGHYYAVQAMWQAGGKYWNDYYPVVRNVLLKQQGSDGSWKGYGQQAYATSMSLIILQVPYRYLPVLQR